MSRTAPKKSKKKLYANILCDASYVPFKMIVTDGDSMLEIGIVNTSLRNAIKAAKDVYGVSEVLTSRITDKG
jgi:hypothetical protein